jgi:hypothetical protein
VSRPASAASIQRLVTTSKPGSELLGAGTDRRRRRARRHALSPPPARRGARCVTPEHSRRPGIRRPLLVRRPAAKRRSGVNAIVEARWNVSWARTARHRTLRPMCATCTTPRRGVDDAPSRRCSRKRLGGVLTHNGLAAALAQSAHRTMAARRGGVPQGPQFSLMLSSSCW